MTRLADYFAVVGYDHNRGRNGAHRGGGCLLQRFPEKDWPDTPFIEGLEMFCQPQGWSLSRERQEPQFFVCVLTDFNALRHYCAVFCFNEPHAITPTHTHDEEEEGLLEVPPLRSHPLTNGTASTVVSGAHHSIMYAPKCLVLISTLDVFLTFKNCLGLVYTVYSEGLNVSLETLVGNMVGYVQVPAPGGPQVRFSIGAGDKQALQPPLSPTLPVTHTTVLSLFNQLGIRNVLLLFCAAVTENKILFHSTSYTRLTDGCHALKALLYPFTYCHVYIPILPSALVEVLSTPTPFIMGVNSSLRNEVYQLMDVIVVDLDGGFIKVPDSLPISLLNEPFWTEAHNALSQVLHPDLQASDNAFSSSSSLPLATPHILKDKQIRAVFMRLFARLLQGYRSCLTIIRIHHSPVITFHKAAFLGQRGFQECDFVSKLLDCMFFTEFVSQRGLPWRPTDLWDDVYSQTLDQQRKELQDPKRVLDHIKELGQQLYNNENPNPQFEAKIPKPTEGSFTRIHQPMFPHLDSRKVQSIIDEGSSKENKIPKSKETPRIVPIGPSISSLPSLGVGGSSAQRLKVLRDCVSCIFESKISDARKTFPAVLRALKTKAARLALCSELSLHVQRNKAVLEHDQFDLIVRLMNCALQDTTQMDEYGVAAALLPLSAAFCRKLCTGVMQFAYTCIQEHPVWSNHQFWEAAFYQDVQKDIKALYYQEEPTTNSSNNLLYPSNCDETVNNNNNKRYTLLGNEEPSALDIAADRLRVWPSLNCKKQQELNEQEESTLYSQAIHFAYRIVYLKIPIDINASVTRRSAPDNSSASFSASLAESDSMDAESGFEEQEQSDKENNVIRFVTRFVDKVCTEGQVTDDHIKSLHQMIPGVVAMHIETLDMVHKESKRLPPTQKHKIVLPSLIPGEKMEYEGVRVHLQPDGREDGVGVKGAGPVLLPAEGALFLTNYRIIFKGFPTDPYACEQVIVRAVPLTSVTKEKRVSGGQQQGGGLMDQWTTTDGLQIRSATFQLLKVAFDEEVSVETIELVRKQLNRLRHPQSVLQVFAFNGHPQITFAPNRREKDKQGYGTLRGFAKKTLLKTAKAAGIKSAKGRKQDKYVFPSSGGGLTSRRGLSRGTGSTLMLGGGGGSRVSLFPSPAHHANPGGNRVMTLPRPAIEISTEDLTLDETESVEGEHTTAREVDNKTLEKLTERSYYRDYQRTGLGGLHQYPLNSQSPTPPQTGKKTDFRITAINSTYDVCRSYPALVSVPAVISDDCICRVSRLYKGGRFPVATWRHPLTKALLLRGACFHSRTALTKLNRGGNSGSVSSSTAGIGTPSSGGPMGATTSSTGGLNVSSDGSSHSVEHEKFISAIVAATPQASMRQGSAWRLGDSSLSLNSLAAHAATSGIGGENSHYTTSPTRPLPIGGDMFSYPTSPYSYGRPVSEYPSTLTPDVSRRGGANPLTKAINTLRSPVAGGISRWGSIRRPSAPSPRDNFSFSGLWENLSSGGTLKPPPSYLGTPPPLYSMDGSSPSRIQSMEISESQDPNSEVVRAFNTAALYIFGEKTHLKGLKTDAVHKTEFIIVDYPDVMQVKAAFKKLMRACIPSTSTSDQEQTYYRLVESSEWLMQLSSLLQRSGAVVDLTDLLGASVMLLLEDGADFTAQVSSLAQVCLDPFYRTIEGFRALVEKEWLAYGHKFLNRGNVLHTSQTAGFAPIFLQFLDAVHQIQRQFPLSFEFNEYYLRFLAYHSVSGRFRTFLSDSEIDRVELGIMSEEDKRGSLSRHHKGLEVTHEDDIYPTAGTSRMGSPSNTGNALGQSVFDYIEKLASRSPVFYNFLYSTERPADSLVLRPVFSVASLCVWEYLVGEELRHGAPYEPEVRHHDHLREEEDQAADGSSSRNSERKVITRGYDCMMVCEPDVFTAQLEELRQLEQELGHLPHKWSMHWDKLELPPQDTMQRQVSVTTQLVREHGRSVHKRSTLELLVRAKTLTTLTSSSALPPPNSNTIATDGSSHHHPHRFEKFNYATPAYCDHCSSVLWGPIKTGLRCLDCGCNCHEKCVESVGNSCTRYKACRDIAVHTQPAQQLDTQSIASGVASQKPSQQTYEDYSSNVPENRTHEGFLWKRGSLLKNWKQRWFVLDSMKHQLRYYDSNDDPQPKGIIDMSDVVAVFASQPTQGAPKKACFDLQTRKRIYNFCAMDSGASQEWIEKIQACLQ